MHAPARATAGRAAPFPVATATLLLLCLVWARLPSHPADPVVLVLSDRLRMGVHLSDLLHLGAMLPVGVLADVWRGGRRRQT